MTSGPNWAREEDEGGADIRKRKGEIGMQFI